MLCSRVIILSSFFVVVVVVVVSIPFYIVTLAMPKHIKVQKNAIYYDQTHHANFRGNPL